MNVFNNNMSVFKNIICYNPELIIFSNKYNITKYVSAINNLDILYGDIIEFVSIEEIRANKYSKHVSIIENRDYEIMMYLESLNIKNTSLFNLPSIIINKYNKFWYKYGKLHRENNMPSFITNSKTKYHKYGKSHRIDGPAVILLRDEEIWYKNGKLHRDNDINGNIQPSVICYNSVIQCYTDQQISVTSYEYYIDNKFIKIVYIPIKYE